VMPPARRNVALKRTADASQDFFMNANHLPTAPQQLTTRHSN
jgi:hypothetical protein